MKLLRYLSYALVGVVTIILISCGTPGIPLPPSLELPRQVTDLRAIRKGDRVYLAWSVPSKTTDLQNVRHFGVTRVCRSFETPIKSCDTVAGEVPPSQTPIATSANGKPGTPQKPVEASFTDTLQRDLQMQNLASKATYAVSVMNAEGRSAGLSNQVQVPAAPTLPPPSDFRAALSAEGVALSWTPVTTSSAQGLTFKWRIYRKEPGQTGTIAGEVALASSTFVDKSFEWQKTYEYRMAAVTSVAVSNSPDLQVEGDDTPVIKIAAIDTFPPAVPAGLQAVAAGVGQPPSIDLIWAPASEADIAGYNVYRHEEGETQPAKVNSEVVKTPSYRDTTVISGKKYSYSVSAVDLRGNESGRSEEASETVP